MPEKLIIANTVVLAGINPDGDVRPIANGPAVLAAGLDPDGLPHILAVDADGNLSGGGGSSDLASAHYTRTAGDYTTTSTSFVDVDATNLALTIVTQARRVMIVVSAIAKNAAVSQVVRLDVDLDGARLGMTDGLASYHAFANGGQGNIGFTWITDVLSAGSHIFKLQWKVSGSTGTLFGGGGAGGSGTVPLRMSVMELAE